MKCYIYVLRLRREEDYTHVFLQKYLEKKHIDLKGCGIIKNKNGQPFLSAKENLYPLSVSHKDKYVCVAFSKNSIYLGIDIEKINQKTLSLAKEFCEEREIEDIKTSKNKEEVATLYWTIKEAVGKAYGEGLLIHPKKTYFNRKNMTIMRKDLPVSSFIKTFTKEGYVVSFVAIPKK